MLLGAYKKCTVSTAYRRCSSWSINMRGVYARCRDRRMFKVIDLLEENGVRKILLRVQKSAE